MCITGDFGTVLCGTKGKYTKCSEKTLLSLMKHNLESRREGMWQKNEQEMHISSAKVIVYKGGGEVLQVTLSLATFCNTPFGLPLFLGFITRKLCCKAINSSQIPLQKTAST